MNRNTLRTSSRLRLPGLICLFAVGILSILASGGGGGGGAAPPSAGTIQLSATSFDASEGTVVNIRVSRSGGSSGVASVDYATTDGTADAGSDYSGASGTLTWQNDVGGNQTISIPLSDDVAAEFTETFTVTLSNVSAATLGTDRTATVNIVDNDSTSLSALGAITSLSSATVNDITYGTGSTNVIVNGAPGVATDLELGQVVSIEGDANLSEATGTADMLTYFAMIIGPVENIDQQLKQLVVMGQTVILDSDTEFDPLIDPDTLAGLTLGETVQISGFRNADQEIIATRIEIDNASTDVQLIGAVSGLDLTNLLFTIDRQTVDYGSASIIELPAGMPADGLFVIVRGSLTDGILVVDEIRGARSVPNTPGRRVHLSGIVTRFASTSDFDLNGLPISTDSGTRFLNGQVADLQANAEVTIDGAVTSGGDLVRAGAINFGPPIAPRSTLPFNFQNFSRISVLGISRVTIVQDANYAIDVTAATEIVGAVQVTQNGDTVSFSPPTGNQNALYTATVTMPLLSEVDVAAGSLANVTISGFDQALMTVKVDGVSQVHGDSLTINSLTADVSGVSLLDFGEISPIPNAVVGISGVSQATLNMGVGSTLSGSVTTGQGTGVSRLFYYGTGVNLNVTTDAQSIVTKLGETR